MQTDFLHTGFFRSLVMQDYVMSCQESETYLYFHADFDLEILFPLLHFAGHIQCVKQVLECKFLQWDEEEGGLSEATN